MQPLIHTNTCTHVRTFTRMRMHTNTLAHTYTHGATKWSFFAKQIHAGSHTSYNIHVRLRLWPDKKKSLAPITTTSSPRLARHQCDPLLARLWAALYKCGPSRENKSNTNFVHPRTFVPNPMSLAGIRPQPVNAFGTCWGIRAFRFFPKSRNAFRKRSLVRRTC